MEPSSGSLHPHQMLYSPYVVTEGVGTRPAPLSWQDTPACWAAERFEVLDLRECREVRQVSRKSKGPSAL